MSMCDNTACGMMAAVWEADALREFDLGAKRALQRTAFTFRILGRRWQCSATHSLPFSGIR